MSGVPTFRMPSEYVRCLVPRCDLVRCCATGWDTQSATTGFEDGKRIGAQKLTTNGALGASFWTPIVGIQTKNHDQFDRVAMHLTEVKVTGVGGVANPQPIIRWLLRFGADYATGRTLEATTQLITPEGEYAAQIQARLATRADLFARIEPGENAADCTVFFRALIDKGYATGLTRPATDRGDSTTIIFPT